MLDNPGDFGERNVGSKNVSAERGGGPGVDGLGIGARHFGKRQAQLAPKRVKFTGYAPGTIAVDPHGRRLYYVESRGVATRYVVGVGRTGTSLKGNAVVGHKAVWPSWRPTDDMIRRRPWRYGRYRNGVPGGSKNSLGSRALYLYRDGKDTYYRIHGTNNPSSIGRAVSNGCIRMLNEHVEQLYARVPIGARVTIL
jgi:lipoprotein-anchoring transpeptidase ErfK/SrfK